MIKKEDSVIVRGQSNGKVFGVNPGKKTVTVYYDGSYKEFPWGSLDVDPVNPDADWDAARNDLLEKVNGLLMNYWIVVESQSREEIESGGTTTIWSPANITSGNKASYESIKNLKRGDVIFHVGDHCITGVSEVIGDIQENVTCPYSEGSAFDGMIGYQVPVKWLYIFIPPIDLSTNQMINFIKEYCIVGVKDSPSAFDQYGKIWRGAYLHRLELKIAKRFIRYINDPALVKRLPPVKLLPPVK